MRWCHNLSRYGWTTDTVLGATCSRVPHWIFHLYLILVDVFGCSEYDVLHSGAPVNKNVCVVKYNSRLMMLCHLKHFFSIRTSASPIDMNFCEPLPKNSDQLGLMSILQKGFSPAGDLHWCICYIYVCRQYRSSFQMLICFCWQWIAAAIK